MIRARLSNMSRILSLLFMLVGTSTWAEQIHEVGNFAEWDRPKEVLMHTPGEELFLGVVHPDAALFERAFDIKRVAQEHRNYIKLLELQGAKVHTVVETLLEGTIDKGGRPVPGRALDQLREFARTFVRIDTVRLGEENRASQEDYLNNKVINVLHPRELVDIILNQPTIHLIPTDINTQFTATYELSPVMNLYFLRDQLITTAKGVVIGRMNSYQRDVETRIIEFVIRKLGIDPIYQVTGDGRLEGGDFLPAGDTVFQGQGLRTNAEAIKQLLEHQVYGAKRVVVVKEPWHNQNQMHLDTYFNIISPKLAVLVKERWRGKDGHGRMVKPEETKHLNIDVYELGATGYEIKIRDADFQEYLERVLGFQLIPVANIDQRKYGINFLTVGPRQILGVDGVSNTYKHTLANKGVHATWMDFDNLTGGYGAAHCITQVLNRVPVKPQ